MIKVGCWGGFFLLVNNKGNKTRCNWHHTIGDAVGTMWHIIINPSGDLQFDTQYADLTFIARTLSSPAVDWNAMKGMSSSGL